MILCKACRQPVFYIQQDDEKYLVCDTILNPQKTFIVTKKDGNPQHVTPHAMTCAEPERLKLLLGGRHG